MTAITMHTEFEAFVGEAQPRLQRALVAAYGPDEGREATAAALAWAWEHRDRLSDLDNPLGYLYRVGQSSRRRRKDPVVLPEPPAGTPEYEPGLAPALAELTVPQRVSVLLLDGYGWTQAEVADLLGISISSVRTHRRRGLAHLRQRIGKVSSDG